MENMENKMQTTELSPREEYHQEFLPQVHKIGATTMAIALILSLLPTIYFVFIKGIEVPLSHLYQRDDRHLHLCHRHVAV